MDEEPDELTPAARGLLADLNSLTGRPCQGCRSELCGHEALFSVALGCKDAPRCLGCLAAGLARTPADLRDQLTQHFAGRDCYSVAWRIACRREGTAITDRPACLERESTPAASAVRTTEAAAGPPLLSWDAGDLACGDLVLALRRRLNEMPPGSVMELIARDPAAPEDLPAWCRLTGHRLVSAAHPTYLVQRKGA
jgi:tRNA 2-thiouridine synthesizing protein A